MKLVQFLIISYSPVTNEAGTVLDYILLSCDP